MTKFVSSPGAAYEVAVGVTAEEAAEQGLTVVEQSFSTIPPTPIYGRYKDAPSGYPLGVTVDSITETKVVGGGGVGSPMPSGGGDKGSLLNVNDPVVHGGTGETSMHADNALPFKGDATEQEALLRAGAHDPAKAAPTGKDAKANAK